MSASLGGAVLSFFAYLFETFGFIPTLLGYWLLLAIAHRVWVRRVAIRLDLAWRWLRLRYVVGFAWSRRHFRRETAGHLRGRFPVDGFALTILAQPVQPTAEEVSRRRLRAVVMGMSGYDLAHDTLSGQPLEDFITACIQEADRRAAHNSVPGRTPHVG